MLKMVFNWLKKYESNGRDLFGGLLYGLAVINGFGYVRGLVTDLYFLIHNPNFHNELPGTDFMSDVLLFNTCLFVMLGHYVSARAQTAKLKELERIINEK